MNVILLLLLILGVMHTESSTTESQLCVTRWSTWINRLSPKNNNGDYESFTAEEKKKFCPGGTINMVECQTTSGIPTYSTGAIQTCTPEKGLVCNNADNYPIPCDDYQIRYHCFCNQSATPVFTQPIKTTLTSTPSISQPLSFISPQKHTASQTFRSKTTYTTRNLIITTAANATPGQFEVQNGQKSGNGSVWVPLGIGISAAIPVSCCVICFIIVICKRKSKSKKISSEKENLSEGYQTDEARGKNV